MKVMDSRLVDILTSLHDCQHQDVQPLLIDLKLLVNSANSIECKQFAYSSSWDVLFTYLYSSNREVCQLVCDILGRLLNAMEPVKVYSEYETHLKTGLKHVDGLVRQLCCVQLERVCKENMSLVLKEPDFLALLLDCICMEGEPSEDTPSRASHLLTLIGTSQAGQEALFSPSGFSFNHLNNLLNTSSSTVYFRLMQVVINCCQASKPCLNLGRANSFLSSLLCQVRDSSDVLSQVVAIEMLSQLATCYHGYEWLQEENVMSDLIGQLDTSPENDPFVGLIQPMIMKFFATAAASFPSEVLSDNRKFYVKIADLIASPLSELTSNAIDCLSVISSTNKGKLTVMSALEDCNNSSLCNVVQRLGVLAREGTSQTKVEALHCVASLITVQSDTTDEDLIAYCEELFYHLDNQPLEFLLKISKNPFKDLRLAVHLIYIGLAQHAWGQKVMSEHATFCEYLLDRNTEKEKEGHELKYKIITNLLSSPTTTQIFPPPYIIKLKVYERQGPLFVQSSSQVAFKES